MSLRRPERVVPRRGVVLLERGDEDVAIGADGDVFEERWGGGEVARWDGGGEGLREGGEGEGEEEGEDGDAYVHDEERICRYESSGGLFIYPSIPRT